MLSHHVLLRPQVPRYFTGPRSVVSLSYLSCQQSCQFLQKFSCVEGNGFFPFPFMNCDFPVRFDLDIHQFVLPGLNCPVCGNPVINECENAQHTDGDFIRSGRDIIRGTHRCKPTDVFCGTCGVLTAFGRNHGPQFRMWLSSWGGERCRIREAHYPEIFPSGEGRLQRCPS